MVLIHTEYDVEDIVLVCTEDEEEDLVLVHVKETNEGSTSDLINNDYSSNDNAIAK